MNAVSPTRPGFLQKVCQLSTKPTPFTGHHLDSQRLKDNIRLNMSSPVVLGRGPEKIGHRFCKSTHRFNINFNDLRHTNLGVVAADVNYDLAVFTFSFSKFGFNAACSGPWHAIVMPGQLTMVAGVANLMFLRTESPMTRVCF